MMRTSHRASASVLITFLLLISASIADTRPSTSTGRIEPVTRGIDLKTATSPLPGGTLESQDSANYFWDVNGNGACQLNILGMDADDRFADRTEAGDFNNDGLLDLVVSAEAGDGPSNLRQDCGEVYIYFSDSSLVGDSIPADSADVHIYGRDAGDGFGFGLSCGDVNGDAVTDLIVGSAWADGIGDSTFATGEVYIFFGPFSTSTVIDLQVQNPDVVIYGPQTTAGTGANQIGSDIATGDIDGDSIDDIVIAAMAVESPDGEMDVPALYVIYGRASWPSGSPVETLSDIFAWGTGSQDALYQSPPNSGETFIAVDPLAVGDINCDTYDDILFLFPGADGLDDQAIESGEVRVVYGGPAVSDSIRLQPRQYAVTTCWDTKTTISAASYLEDPAAVISLTDSNLLMVYRGEFLNLVSRTSTDGGATWSAPATVSDQGNCLTPFLHMASDGVLWLAWCSDAGGTFDPYYTMSYDSGATWETPFRQISTSAAHNEPVSIIEPEPGTLHIYVDAANRIVSTDNGTTFSSLENIGYTGIFNSRAFQSSSGRIFLVGWTGSEIQYLFSDDATASWEGYFYLGDAPGGPGCNPSMYEATDGTLYAIWHDAYPTSSDDEDIFVAVSNDTGLTWSSRFRVTCEPYREIVYSPGVYEFDGDYYLIYSNDSSGNFDLYQAQFQFDTLDLQSESDAVIFGVDDWDRPLSVSAFDVNDDACDDIVVGVRYGDGPANDRMDAGEGHIYYGPRISDDTMYISSASSDIAIYMADPDDRVEVLAPSDVDGDGQRELLVASYRADGPNNSRADCGEIQMLLLPETPPSEIDLATYPREACIFGGHSGEFLGVFPLLAADFTGDGKTEIVASATIGEVFGIARGRVNIIDASVFLNGDVDGDAVEDLCDNCGNYNPSQVNSDSDGLADACDNCPTVTNPGQEDLDSDGIGDACDNLSVAWDTIYTPSGVGLTLSSHGNAGNSGVGGVNADFVGAGTDCEAGDNPLAEVYVYNASPMLMKSAVDYSLQIWWNEVTNSHPEFNFRSVFDGVPMQASTDHGAQKYTSGTFVSSDTTVAVTANWWAAGGGFFVVRHDYYSYDGGTHENVRLGHFYDFDVPNDTSLGVAVNEGGSGGEHPTYVWQRGIDDPAQSPPGCTPSEQRYAVAGMLGYYYDSEQLVSPQINHTDFTGAKVVANDDIGREAGDPTDVFSPESLWIQLGRSGYYVNNSGAGSDQRSILAYGDFTISTDTLRIYTVMGSIYSGSESDVADVVDSAELWYWSNLRGTERTDADGDGIQDPLDNCPGISNKDQADADGDGVGDACDACDPVITAYPPANTIIAPVGATVSAQFDQSMDPSSFDSLTYVAHGEISGPHAGSISAAQTAASLNPYGDFVAGEKVTVTLTDSIRCSGGESIVPYCWQFIAAAAAGSGTFDEKRRYPGHDVEEVCFADIDNDGDPDLVMGSWNFSRVEVRLNLGNGYFDTAVAYNTPGEPASMAAGDLNGDGYMDLVAGYTFLGTDSSISILMNNGDATFAAPVTYLSGPCPPTIQTVDIDGDGDLDLVHGASCNSQDIFILPNNGDGTFGLPISYQNFAHANSCDVADVNGDGLLDIVTASAVSNYVGIFLQNSDHTFQDVVTYPAGDSARTVNAIDLNGDLAVDVVVADRYVDSVGILFNNGDGTFQTLVQYSVADEPCAVYAADIDGDEDVDLLVGDLNLTWLVNDGTGAFSTGGSLDPGFGGYTITAVDLDSDGDLDIAATNIPNDTLLLLLREVPGDADGDGIPDASDNCPFVFNPGQQDLDGDGLGNVCDPDIDADGFDNPFDNCPYIANPGQEDFDLDGLGDACDPDTMNFTPTVEETADYTFVQTADLDRDNNADVVYTGLSDTGLFVRFGSATGNLEAPINYLEVAGAAVVIDYVDLDTLLDIVAHTTDSLFLLLNEGNRVFSIYPVSLPVPVAGYREPQANGLPSVATGYLDNDDNLDMVISPNQVLYSDGAGGVLYSQTIATFQGVVVCDFVKDGIDDIVLIEGDSVKVYTRDPGGQYFRVFAAFIGTPAADATPRVISSDFNLDGLSDIATLVTLEGETPSAELTVLLSNGQGDTLGSTRIQITGAAYDLSQADFNKDGAPDIALTNATTADIDIYLGDATGQFEGPFVVDIGTSTDVPAVLAALDLDRDGNSDLVSGVSGGGDVVIAENDGADEPVIEHEMFITAFTNATFRVTNPAGLIISREVRTVAGSDYRRFDYNGDGYRDEQSLDYNVEYGMYVINADTRAGFDPGAQGCDFAIGIDGSQQYAIARELKLTVKKRPEGTEDVGAITFHFPFEPEFTTIPGYGQPTATLTPTIDWSRNTDTAGVLHYRFQMDIHPAFLTPRLDIDGLTSPRVTLSEPLGLDSIYYWRYRVERPAGWSDWTWEFAMLAAQGCCTGVTGNVNDDEVEAVDITDLSNLVNYLFVTFERPGCMAECNTSGDIGCAVDLSDLTKLVNHLFVTFEPLAECMSTCEQ